MDELFYDQIDKLYMLYIKCASVEFKPKECEIFKKDSDKNINKD